MATIATRYLQRRFCLVVTLTFSESRNGYVCLEEVLYFLYSKMELVVTLVSIEGFRTFGVLQSAYKDGVFSVKTL